MKKATYSQLEERTTQLLTTDTTPLVDAEIYNEIDIDANHQFFKTCVDNFDALPTELQEMLNKMAWHVAESELGSIH